jgi:hypothetical protein
VDAVGGAAKVIIMGNCMGIRPHTDKIILLLREGHKDNITQTKFSKDTLVPHIAEVILATVAITRIKATIVDFQVRVPKALAQHPHSVAEATLIIFNGLHQILEVVAANIARIRHMHFLIKAHRSINLTLMPM